MVDDILRLEVSVNDLVLVHVVQGLAHLLYQVPRHLFRYLPFFAEKVVQLTGVTQLKHQVYVAFIGEEGVHLDDVGVVEETLYLDLPNELHHQFAVDVGLVDLLQSAHEACCLMTA